MKLLPEYSANIVVAAVHNGKLRWFVTYKEVWFLDAVRFAAAFSVEPSQQELQIANALEQGNPDPFLRSISDYEVRIDELREWFSLNALESSDRDDWLPSLFTDFDNRRMLNVFAEPSGMFHEYLPNGWHGDYSDRFHALEECIPKSDRYWDDDSSEAESASRGD